MGSVVPHIEPWLSNTSRKIKISPLVLLLVAANLCILDVMHFFVAPTVFDLTKALDGLDGQLGNPICSMLIINININNYIIMNLSTFCAFKCSHLLFLLKSSFLPRWECAAVELLSGMSVACGGWQSCSVVWERGAASCGSCVFVCVWESAEKIER